MGYSVDNITGLQLVLSDPPWSDGKGKEQFTFQWGRNAGFQTAITVSKSDTPGLSCSSPGFINTSDSWECQIIPPPPPHTHTEQLEQERTHA